MVHASRIWCITLYAAHVAQIHVLWLSCQNILIENTKTCHKSCTDTIPSVSLKIFEENLLSARQHPQRVRYSNTRHTTLPLSRNLVHTFFLPCNLPPSTYSSYLIVSRTLLTHSSVMSLQTRQSVRPSVPGVLLGFVATHSYPTSLTQTLHASNLAWECLLALARSLLVIVFVFSIKVTNALSTWWRVLLLKDRLHDVWFCIEASQSFWRFMDEECSNKLLLDLPKNKYYREVLVRCSRHDGHGVATSVLAVRSMTSAYIRVNVFSPS